VVPQRKKKPELPYDPRIPRLGIHPKELKTETRIGICAPVVAAALFIKAQRWKQPRCLLEDE
jgi:hypothetical protein